MSAIEERIGKLLALADSPNENEAAAAAEKAQALMLRYGLELATIAASSGERLAVDEQVLDGKVDPWRRMLAAAVAGSAGGRVVWAPDGGRSQGKIFFYGPAGAVGGIVELYRYLEAQLVVISAAATAERRERRVHGRTWRNSFLLGAVGRLGQRLDARRAKTIGTGDNSRALVLVKTAVDRPGSGRARRVARGDGHGRDRRSVGLPGSGQELLEVLTAALSRDNDLARRRVPHQKPADAGVAAEQRVPTPDRSGERLGQLALAAAPAGKLALVRVLERHRGDAALAAAAPREAHQRSGGLPALELLPHPLLGEQLPPPWVKTRGVRLAGAPAGRRLAQLARLRLAGRARSLPPAARSVQHPRGLPAKRLVWQRSPLRAPQVGHSSSSHSRRSLIPLPR